MNEQLNKANEECEYLQSQLPLKLLELWLLLQGPTFVERQIHPLLRNKGTMYSRWECYRKASRIGSSPSERPKEWSGHLARICPSSLCSELDTVHYACHGLALSNRLVFWPLLTIVGALPISQTCTSLPIQQ